MAYAGKSKGNPHNPGNPHTPEHIIDEIRDTVMDTIFKEEGLHAHGQGTPERSWFEGAKQCDLVNIMEASSLIESAVAIDQRGFGAGDPMNPNFDWSKWGELRSRFYQAVRENCHCKSYD